MMVTRFAFALAFCPRAAADALSRAQSGFLGIDTFSDDDDSSLGKMKRTHPYYHTTEEMYKEVDRLAKVCHADMEVTHETQTDVSLKVVRVRSKQAPSNATKINRAFLLFGEHSRELISPESGLYFLRQLCGDVDMHQGQDRNEFLAASDVMLVLNANPRSRKQVESGHYCIRTNPDGVDLNRNWDEKFAKQDNSITNPGPHPFSEPETKILKRLVEDFKPTTFVTIHSGTRGMYMPWAFDMEHLAQKNGPAMRRILEEVDTDYCQCPFGAAGKEVGYSCPGTCLDWVYDKLETPYVFAYEIYTGRSPNIGDDDELKFRFEQQRKAEKHDSDGEESLLQLFSGAQSGVDMSEEESPEVCFSQFNPDTEERYNSAVANWAAAYVNTLSLVARDMNQSPSKSISAERGL